MKALLIVTTVVISLSIFLFRLNPQVIQNLTPDLLRPTDSNWHANIEIAAWLWISPGMLDVGQINQYLDKAEQEHISTIYVYSDDVLSFSSLKKSNDAQASSDWKEKAKVFIFEAHRRGIKVHALGGAPNWAYKEKHLEALDFFDYIISYNESVTSDLSFDGIQFDIEPYGQSNYLGNEVPAMKSFLALVEKIAKKYDDAKVVIGEQFQLGFAVPYWLDGEDKASMLSLDGKEIRGAVFYLLDILNRRSNTYIAIMDYRNMAEGPDGSIAHARDEIEYGEIFAPNVGIFIGQEITDVLPSKVTFYGKSKEVLNKEMEKIARAFKGKSVFKGFSIHTLEGYIQMK